MNDESTSNEATKGGGKTQSRQGHYAKFEPLVVPAVEKLQKLLESRNESTALGAIKLILERTLPAIKAIEVTGESGEPIKLTIIGAGGFIPQSYAFTASSTGSAIQPSAEIQGVGVAQESQKDNDSDNGNGQAGAA